MLNLANILTLFRLAILPLIVLGLYLGNHGGALFALILYIIGSLTDFLDGWVARKFNQITPLGTFLDPIADKIYVATVFVSLVAAGHITGLWVLTILVILTREFLVSGLREFLGPHKVQMPVTNLAKWKTASQMACLCFLIMSPYSFWLNGIGKVLLLAATVLTVMTGWVYLKSGLAHIKEMK